MRRRRVARAAVGTAVVAGTAGAVRHHQQKRWDKKDQEQYAQQQEQYAQQEEYYEEEPQYVDEPAPPAASGPDLTQQLQQLADLHASGVLSDEEFASAKAKLLNG
ncbi:MAG: SHOCT domain-containing protein [Candidatus Promineifilaceae bacterium]|nr:SHOCT domain-containing protein [Candidatus Promineifilaceae bacterium]